MKPDKTSPDQAVRIQAESRTFLADLQTPVGIYLKVRDLFPESALLESSDYHTSENSYSFIASSRSPGSRSSVTQSRNNIPTAAYNSLRSTRHTR